MTKDSCLQLSALVLLAVLLACSPVPTLVSIPPTITPAVLTSATRTAPAPISPISTATAIGDSPEVLNPTPTEITPTATVIRQPPSAIGYPPSTISQLLPIILTDTDLGVSFEQPLQHALALDPVGGHIFVGVPPTLTLVLSADDLSLAKTLPVGGDLAIDSVRTRLYVGAPDGVAVFDLDSLERVGTIPVAASRFGSTPIVDRSIGNIFVIRNGVYIVDPVSLQVTGRISGTFPISLTSAFAVDAAFDAERRLLYVSLNNGIPGSNNGNTLMVHSLRTNETVYRDNERSIISLQADGRAGVSLSRAASPLPRSTCWRMKPADGSQRYVSIASRARSVRICSADVSIWPTRGSQARACSRWMR
jgi:hypothetical protein